MSSKRKRFTLEEKLRILSFSKTHTVKQTVESVRILGREFSDKTLYRWIKQERLLLEAKKPVRLLAPKSTKPKKIRECEYSLLIPEYIIQLRRQYPKMGKVKLKVFIDRFCDTEGITKVSESTIGRILKKLKDSNRLIEYKDIKEVYLDGRTGRLHRVKNKQYKIKKIRKPKELVPTKVGELVQFDAVTIQLKGKKYYFLNAIDIASRKAFSFPAKKLNSYNARLALIEFSKELNQPIQSVQTDNGLEHYKHFEQYLNKNDINHYWNRPRTPKSNAYIERMNRTLQEECLNHHKHKLPTSSIEEVKEIVKDYLYYYNCIRPHRSLQNKTPQSVYDKLT